MKKFILSLGLMLLLLGTYDPGLLALEIDATARAASLEIVSAQSTELTLLNGIDKINGQAVYVLLKSDDVKKGKINDHKEIGIR
ncbi:MAG: hypothetical protein GXO88_09420 [Chlorobi bacterium]|nr:hypothetical protein [Chlorobiota bacterium]